VGRWDGVRYGTRLDNDKISIRMGYWNRRLTRTYAKMIPWPIASVIRDCSTSIANNPSYHFQIDICDY
jgi:hypothetical protein